MKLFSHQLTNPFFQGGLLLLVLLAFGNTASTHANRDIESMFSREALEALKVYKNKLIEQSGFTADEDKKKMDERLDPVSVAMFPTSPDEQWRIGGSLYANRYTFIGSFIDSERRKGTSQSVIDAHLEEAMNKRNFDLLDRMNKLPVVKTKHDYLTAELTEKQLIDAVRSIEGTPFQDNIQDQKDVFDPAGAYGFCFGRAHFQYHSAVLRGLDFQSTAKVFVVGKMAPKVPGTDKLVKGWNPYVPLGGWQFHVATAVRGPGGVWYALDNHLPKYDKRTYTVKEWYEYYENSLEIFEDFDIKLNPVKGADGVQVARANAVANARALALYFTHPLRIGAGEGWSMNSVGYLGVENPEEGIDIKKALKYYNGFFAVMTNYFAYEIGKCDRYRFHPSVDSKTCTEFESLLSEEFEEQTTLLKNLKTESLGRDVFCSLDPTYHFCNDSYYSPLRSAIEWVNMGTAKKRASMALRRKETAAATDAANSIKH